MNTRAYRREGSTILLPGQCFIKLSQFKLRSIFAVLQMVVWEQRSLVLGLGGKQKKVLLWG